MSVDYDGVRMVEGERKVQYLDVLHLSLIQHILSILVDVQYRAVLTVAMHRFPYIINKVL